MLHWPNNIYRNTPTYLNQRQSRTEFYVHSLAAFFIVSHNNIYICIAHATNILCGPLACFR